MWLTAYLVVTDEESNNVPNKGLNKLNLSQYPEIQKTTVEKSALIIDLTIKKEPTFKRKQAKVNLKTTIIFGKQQYYKSRCSCYFLDLLPNKKVLDLCTQYALLRWW